MDLQEIQKIQEEFVRSRKWDRFKATQVFSHLIEELGEVVKHFLYEEGYKIKGAGHDGATTEISQEFAQAFNLFLQLAIIAGVNLEEAWKKEHQRMEKRFSEQTWKRLAEKAD